MESVFHRHSFFLIDTTLCHILFGEKRTGCQEIHQFLLVVVRNRNVFFSENDAVTFDHRDLFRLDDERAMYPNEAIGGQQFFQGLHAHERQNRLRIILRIDLDVIFQPLDIQNLAQLDLNQFVFRLDKDTLLFLGNRFACPDRLCVLLNQVIPLQRLVGCL